MNPFNNPGTVGRPGTVAGLFRHGAEAEQAIRELKAAGFADTQIGVITQDRDEQSRLAHEASTKAAKGAATGAVSGGVLGGIVGLLAWVGAFVIPGVGPIVAVGGLASTLVGAGLGATAGSLLGALTGMGIPEHHARYYESALREGGILVTVDAGSQEVLAHRILLNAAATSRVVKGDGGRAHEPSKSHEKRTGYDPSYTGPDRRMVSRP